MGSQCCWTSSRIAWSNTALDQTHRVTPGAGISFFPPPGITKKKATFRPQWDRLEVAPFATSLTSPQASTWCSLFSSFHQSHPQGRESEGLKVESGAAKSGWNGSPLCWSERGNAKGKPPAVGAFVPGVKCGRSGRWRRMGLLRQSVQSDRGDDGRGELLFACMLALYTTWAAQNCDPIAAPLPAGTFRGPWLFLLTSNLCWELASDKIYRRWSGNSTEAWTRQMPRFSDIYFKRCLFDCKSNSWICEIVLVSVLFPRASWFLKIASQPK